MNNGIKKFSFIEAPLTLFFKNLKAKKNVEKDDETTFMVLLFLIKRVLKF